MFNIIIWLNVIQADGTLTKRNVIKLDSCDSTRYNDSEFYSAKNEISHVRAVHQAVPR